MQNHPSQPVGTGVQTPVENPVKVAIPQQNHDYI